MTDLIVNVAFPAVVLLLLLSGVAKLALDRDRGVS